MSQPNREWYYAKGDQQVGPVSTEDLQARVQSGEVLASDLCWTEGMSTWQPVATRTDVFSISPVVPQAYGQPGPVTPLSYAAPSIGAPVDAFGRPMFYVGFWWRFLAYIIDYLVMLVPGQILNVIMQAAIEGASGLSQEVAIGMALGVAAMQIIVSWLYYALMESSSKQGTLGKMAIGVVVTDLNGNRISFGRATGRYFSKLLSALILCIGYIMIGCTERKQGLHDQLAKTYVLKKQ